METLTKEEVISLCKLVYFLTQMPIVHEAMMKQPHSIREDLFLYQANIYLALDRIDHE